MEVVEASLPPTATPDASGTVSFDGIAGASLLLLDAPAVPDLLWAVHTYGFRNFDPWQDHVVAIYAYQAPGWKQLGWQELECPDVLNEGNLTQVRFGLDQVWLAVEGFTGAHSGCFDLLRFDGEALVSEVSHFNDSPYAGEIKDLNDDGIPEVLLNRTVNYVFCYACGVYIADFVVLRWDGLQLVEVTLTPLPENASEDLRQLNNRAVDLARAELWMDAQDAVEQAAALDPEDQTVAWNALLINLIAEARAEWAHQGEYLLLTNLFYGDYAAVLDELRPYTPEEIFIQPSPLIQSTVAEGWEDSLAFWINEFTTRTLTYQPNHAGAYFLRGWGTFLVELTNPEAVAQAITDIERAVQLDPGEPLFTEGLDCLQSECYLITPPG